MKDEHDPFLALRGIFRDEFRALGGGEAFISNEREEFSREMEQREERIQKIIQESRRARQCRPRR